MGWSIPLVTVRGTVVRIHLTFLLFLAWIAASHAWRGGLPAAAAGVAFISAVFLCVLLHEFGHVAAAARYGIATADITLFPIGGLARLSHVPEEPGREIAIALAGPAVNGVIALSLWALLGMLPDPAEGFAVDDPGAGLLARLFWVNLFLALFNLIPAFPMDGGRVLRALLAFRLGHREATRRAARIGQAVAVLLGFVGLFGAPLLIFIALFVWLAAAGEAAEVDARAIIRGLTAADAMETRFEALTAEATVAAAAEALLRTPQQDFPVLDAGGRVLGLLTRDAIIHTLRAGQAERPVVEAMVEIPQVPRHMALEEALRSLETAPAVAVAESDGRLVGLLTPTNLAELLALRG